MIFPFLIGTTLGTVAGFFGGIVDTIFMRLVDIILAFPFLVLMLSIIAILGPGLDQLLHRHGAGRLGLLRPADPRADAGAEEPRLRGRRRQPRLQPAAHHVPPPAAECRSPARVVFAMSDAVLVLLNGAAISYLGLGVQPPVAEWGVMVAEGQAFITTAWWITLFPGLAIVTLAFAFSLLGDGLADLLGRARVTAPLLSVRDLTVDRMTATAARAR